MHIVFTIYVNVDQEMQSRTLDFPFLAAATKDGTSNLSPGPKMLLGRMQHVNKPFIPFAFITNASPSALVEEYESLC